MWKGGKLAVGKFREEGEKKAHQDISDDRARDCRASSSGLDLILDALEATAHVRPRHVRLPRRRRGSRPNPRGHTFPP